jgi:hypothetical protein
MAQKVKLSFACNSLSSLYVLSATGTTKLSPELYLTITEGRTSFCVVISTLQGNSYASGRKIAIAESEHSK